MDDFLFEAASLIFLIECGCDIPYKEWEILCVHVYGLAMVLLKGK